MQAHLTFFCSFTLNLIYFIHLPLLIRLIYLKKKTKILILIVIIIQLYSFRFYYFSIIS